MSVTGVRSLAAAAVLCAAACDFDASQPPAAPATSTADLVDSRRVWRGVEGNFYAVAPSPDGRLVTAIDWSTGNLAVRDLETGELRQVTAKGTWEDNSDYAEYSVFSPDGRRIAYSWLRDGAGYQLRVIDLDGSNDRVLVPHAEDLAYVVAEDWSSDGKRILVALLHEDRSSTLATVSVQTGELRTLRSGDWRLPVVAAFSRDGEWIAFDSQPGTEGQRHDILLIPANGGRETRLVGGSSSNLLLGWLPDGSGILFYSDRDGTRGVWKQQVSDGRAVGEPQLVLADIWQLVPVGFSRDAYFFGVYVAMPQVHIATLDASADHVIVPPARVQSANEEPTRFGAWSADGGYFAYLRVHLDRTEDLVIRSVDGADTREIEIDLDQASQIQWHPDGRTIFAIGIDPTGVKGVYAVDVQTGATRVVLRQSEVGASDLLRYRLTPDGRSILYFKNAAAGERGIATIGDVVRRVLATGRDEVLHGFATTGIAFLSPDGQRYVKQDWDPQTGLHSLHVGRTDGAGALRMIYETENELLANRGGFPFTPDGAHVLAAEHRTAKHTSVLLKIPLDGGPPIVLLEWDGNMFDLRLSRDGRHVSFGSGSEIGELWMLEFADPGPDAGDAAAR